MPRSPGRSAGHSDREPGALLVLRHHRGVAAGDDARLLPRPRGHVRGRAVVVRYRLRHRAVLIRVRSAASASLRRG